MTRKTVTKPAKKVVRVKEAKVEYVAVTGHTVVSLSPIVIASHIAELPVEAQELAAEFVMMLRRHYPISATVIEPKATPTDWTKLDAFGIWADRLDMEDSVVYVRELRKREWSQDRRSRNATD